MRNFPIFENEIWRNPVALQNMDKYIVLEETKYLLLLNFL